MPAELNGPLRVEGTTLSNGLEVHRQGPPPAAASFSASFVAPAGYAYDRPGGEGLALVTSLVLTSGAGTRDRVALARFLDRHGATLTRRCDPESSEVTVWGPADAFEPLVDLLADVVLRPRFDASDLKRVRLQVLERQLRETSQPESRAERELLKNVFPAGHPYRSTGVGTRRTVDRLERDDLRRFHRDHFTSAGSLLVLTAPPSLSDLARTVGARFRAFAKESAPPPPSTPAPGRPRSREVRIPMAGRTQVEIRIGGASIPRSDDRYAAGFLANEILGGRSLLSRLFQRVRERAGLAYHTSSDLQAMRWGGLWQAEAGTGPERVGQTARLVAREVARIAHATVPGPELDRIRESAIGELPLALETTSGAHELAVDVAYHHLGPDFLTTWPATLRKLTPRDLRAVGPACFDTERSVTVLAGPLSR